MDQETDQETRRKLLAELFAIIFGLLSCFVAVDVLTDLPAWRVFVGGWSLFLAMQGAVLIVTRDLRERERRERKR